MKKYPFGFWYGRFKSLKNYQVHKRWWKFLAKFSNKLPDYLAGMDTTWYFKRHK